MPRTEPRVPLMSCYTGTDLLDQNLKNLAPPVNCRLQRPTTVDFHLAYSLNYVDPCLGQLKCPLASGPANLYLIE